MPYMERLPRVRKERQAAGMITWIFGCSDRWDDMCMKISPVCPFCCTLPVINPAVPVYSHISCWVYMFFEFDILKNQV